MQQAALRMQVVQEDAQLLQDVEAAILRNRQAIFNRALEQLTARRIQLINAIPKPSRLDVHNASRQAIGAAVAIFEQESKMNNELADIINPRLRQAQEERRKQSKEYQLQQAFLKVQQEHHSLMKKQSEKEQSQEGQNEGKSQQKQEEAQIVPTLNPPADQPAIKIEQKGGPQEQKNDSKVEEKPEIKLEAKHEQKEVIAPVKSQPSQVKPPENILKPPTNIFSAPLAPEKQQTLTNQQAPAATTVNPFLAQSPKPPNPFSTLLPKSPANLFSAPAPSGNVFSAAALNLIPQSKSTQNPSSTPSFFSTPAQGVPGGLFGYAPSNSVSQSGGLFGQPSSASLSQPPKSIIFSKEPPNFHFAPQPETATNSLPKLSLFGGVGQDATPSIFGGFSKKEDSNFSRHNKSSNIRIGASPAEQVKSSFKFEGSPS